MRDIAETLTEEPALALLLALAKQDGQSLPRLGKHLHLAASELNRLCVALGDDARFDGLGLVEMRVDARGRTCVWLSAQGRDFVNMTQIETQSHGNVSASEDRMTIASKHEGLRDIETLRLFQEAQNTQQASQTFEEQAWRTDKANDWVIEETPVALLYNGLSFAVMMATPTDLDDFALGFALCEGVVASADEFRLVDVVRHAQGIALHAAIPQARFDALESRQRTLEGRSGCGLCGVSSLEAALRPARRVGAGPRLNADEIQRGLARLAEVQPLNSRSGSAHAAAFFAGEHLCVREDVGRHNAVDKVVGALHRNGPDGLANGGVANAIDGGYLAVTSRASYEIVQKAANAGIAVVVAMSAPTDLAIRHAEAAGITLIAFARDRRMNVYTVPERIVRESS
jgi:formate dehydrogenase accessory protein FdhD